MTLFSVNFAFATEIYTQDSAVSTYDIKANFDSLGFGQYKQDISVLPADVIDGTLQYYNFYFQTPTNDLDSGNIQVNVYAITDLPATVQCGTWFYDYNNDYLNLNDHAMHLIQATTTIVNQQYCNRSTNTYFFSFLNIPNGSLTKVDSNNKAYLLWYRNEVPPPPTPPDTSSRIDSISVSTSTGKVNITGYWNATTTTGIFQQLEFYQDSPLYGVESYSTVNATSTGAFNLDFDYRDAITPYTGTTTSSISSKIDFYANLYQKDNNYYNPFGELDIRYSTLLDATSTILTASTTNTWELSTSTSILAYPEYECAITSLTGCFKNAMIWIFYPSSDSMEKYNSFIELIQRKPPVGYFTTVKSSIENLSSTSTSAFTITIPNHLNQYFFNPMDLGIAGILWIYFLFMFYKRLKHIQL